MGKKKTVKITALDKGIMFYGQTKDGMVFGLCLEGVGDIHLITMDDGDFISNHITDRTGSAPLRKNIGKIPKIRYEALMNSRIRWIRKYHGNQKCWVMTQKLMEKIDSDFKNLANSRQIPLELINGQIVLDFDNSDRWKRVRIRELMTIRRVGFVEDGYIIRIVEPFDKNTMFYYSDLQFKRWSHKLARMMGIEEYMDYVINKYGQGEIDRMMETKFS